MAAARARAAFTEAFELAAANFKEKGDEPKRDGLALLVNTPDQRYVVINAVTKRDPSWAKKLTEQMLKQDSEDAEAAATQNPQRDIRTAAKLLDLAATLLTSDAETAKEMSGKVESQAQARELLDEILAAAGKAPDPVVTARSLLAVAFLYAKIDPAQSLSVLSNAIATMMRRNFPGSHSSGESRGRTSPGTQHFRRLTSALRPCSVNWERMTSTPPCPKPITLRIDRCAPTCCLR